MQRSGMPLAEERARNREKESEIERARNRAIERESTAANRPPNPPK